MDTMNIISVVIAGVSAIIAIISIVANLLYNKSMRKKDKRGIPSVAIWFDYNDNIDERLQDGYRWFVALDKLDELVECHYCYFNFTSSIARSYNCHVEIDPQYSESSKNESTSIDIGTIRSAGKIVPVKMPNTKEINFFCSITYDTEENEHMLYTVEFKYNINDHIACNRCDNLFKEKFIRHKKIVKKKHYKYIATYNQKISESFKSSELIKNLAGRSLNKKDFGGV